MKNNVLRINILLLMIQMVDCIPYDKNQVKLNVKSVLDKIPLKQVNTLSPRLSVLIDMAFSFIENTIEKEMNIASPLSLVAFTVMLVVASYIPFFVFRELVGFIHFRQPKHTTDPE